MFKTDDIRFASLTTEQLQLRPLNETDQDAVFRLRSDEWVNQYLDRPACLIPDQALQFIHAIQQKIIMQESMYWAICLKDNNILIGTICLFHFSAAMQLAEIGFELMPAYQGKRYMQEALEAILSLSFKCLKLHTISAVTHIDNKPSINLLKKNNFKTIKGAAKNDYTVPENFIHFLLQHSPSNI